MSNGADSKSILFAINVNSEEGENLACNSKYIG